MKKLFGKKISVLMCIVLISIMAMGCADKTQQKEAVRVAGLKGPTSMGLLMLQEKNANGEAQANYEFSMLTGADEILPLVVKGEVDIALIPANVASVLYNKTNGGVEVIDINTLGVIYMLSGDENINQISDLEGKTIYLTGKGTTPDYVLRYLLKENGLDETRCTLEYKSEATEVAAVLANDSNAVGVLPQPFVTAAMMQNDKLKVVIDTTKEWEKTGKTLVTGVTVVRKEFLEKNKDLVEIFLNEHKESVDGINNDIEKGTKLVVEAGIVAKEPIAKKAIPACNIAYIDGQDMKEALSGYLSVLFDMNPEAVGGKLPEDNFYHMK